MNVSGMFSTTGISASGLAAEKMRMEIAANNIANAHNTMTETGGPFRRQQVVFSDAMNGASVSGNAGSEAVIKGVQVIQITSDNSELPEIYDPGHPHADKRGFVRMPNVAIPVEMVDLMTASRAYESNLKALQTYRQMVEQSLSLLRG